MKTLRVELGTRSYPIFVGRQLLGLSDVVQPHVRGNRVLVVTNQTVGPLFLEATLNAFAAFQPYSIVLPDGEQYKTLQVLNKIFDALLERRFGRDSTLVALGGGVVGDLTGFAAACYQRGVPFIQIPTTLLAQVDSSVGGKTGVNHSLGKNMIGAFHQPTCVVIDTDTLNTLGEREFRAGLAEVIKYGLIRDASFFAWLERHMELLMGRDADALAYAICRSCENKAVVVSADEREAGMRAVLNLGHTFGHAIEAGLGYGQWLHGEAVAAGMCLAADLSARLGWLEPAIVAQIEALITRAGLPVHAPASLSASRMLELMTVDKKNRAGRMRLVLLRAIGQAEVSEEFDMEALETTLRANGSV